MGAARAKRGTKPVIGAVGPAAARAAAAPTPTVVRWSVTDILAAYEELTTLLRANPDGPFGYKASLIRTLLEPYAIAAATKLEELATAYQKQLPADGGTTLPAPRSQNGRDMPLEFWCTNPEEYRLKRARLVSTVNVISFPVRFTHHEVASYTQPERDHATGIVAKWVGIHGAFWRNLYAVIDPPAELADLVLPVPEPTIDPLVAAEMAAEAATAAPPKPSRA